MLDTETNGRAIDLMLVDSRPIFRSGLRRLFESDVRFAIVGEAADPSQALRLFERVQPDILLLRLPNMGGPERRMLRVLAEANRSVKMIVMVPADDEGELIDLFRQGARGVVYEDSAPETLCKALAVVHAGEYWLSRKKMGDLVRALAASHAPDDPDRASALASPDKFHLTPREIELLELVVAGCSNRVIAETMRVGIDTVKHHLTHIFDKTGASSRLELAVFAIHHRLIS